MLPRFDPAALPLPHPLPAVPLDLDVGLVGRWYAALGRPLPAGAEVPPFALTGCTIYLLASHFDIAGGVYWREQVTYHRPARRGERVTVAGRVDGTYVHDGRLYAVMSSTTTGDDGRLLASSRSTGLQQYRRGEIRSLPGGASPPGAPVADPSVAAANPGRQTLAALQRGRVMAGAPVDVSLAMMRALAAGDDRNPIHTDEEMARRAGLRAPIAGGPHVLAFAEAVMLDEAGEGALSHGAHVDARWVSPVYAGDVITPTASVVSIDRASAVFHMEVRVGERLAMAATATVPLGSG